MKRNVFTAAQNKGKNVLKNNHHDRVLIERSFAEGRLSVVVVLNGVEDLEDPHTADDHPDEIEQLEENDQHGRTGHGVEATDGLIFALVMHQTGEDAEAETDQIHRARDDQIDRNPRFDGTGRLIAASHSQCNQREEQIDDDANARTGQGERVDSREFPQQLAEIRALQRSKTRARRCFATQRREGIQVDSDRTKIQFVAIQHLNLVKNSEAFLFSGVSF